MKSCTLIFFAVLLTLSGVLPAKQTANVLTDDAFITHWRICEPIPLLGATDEASQKQAFAAEALDASAIVKSAKKTALVIDAKPFAWRNVSSESGIIQLHKELGVRNFCTVYAVAQVASPKQQQVLLGVGSDDAVKVWLNGQLIHENFIGRAVNADDDLVTATFVKGNNTLLVKILNMESDYGFCLRPIGKNTQAEQMLDAIESGDSEKLSLLLSLKADVNVKIGPGLTPLHLAQIKGKAGMIKQLIDAGADVNAPLPNKEALVDYLFTRAVKGNSPGAAVLIAQDGKVFYHKAFGMANVEQAVPLLPQSTFRIGSITKQFTAAAVLKLQEQGKLSVQDKLSQYIPDLPRGDEITLHHLLTHTSGLASYTDQPDFIGKVTSETSTQEMIDWIKSLGSVFSPGESWAYCNSGYFILGYIVEKVSGQDFNDFLQTHFFQPLGMKNTAVYKRGLDLPHEALGYSFENEKASLALDWNMDFAGGAGNLYADVDDLFKWNEALFNGNLLSPQSVSAAFTPAKLNNGEQAQAFGAGYGYGWAISEFRGLPVIAHGGGLHGFNTVLTRLPQQKMTVVVLSNCAPNLPKLNPSQLANSIMEIYHYPSMTQSAEKTIAKDVNYNRYDDYAGQYDYGQAILTVRRNGNKLMAQLTGQGEFEIFPSAEDKFFWKVADAQIEFVRDDNGQVTHAQHTQNGTTIKVKRIIESTEVKVPTAVLQSFIGDYQLAPNFILSVTLEGDQLFTQATGQPKVEIFAKSETEFFLKVVVASITFVQDADGKVTGLILDQGGARMEAPKIK